MTVEATSTFNSNVTLASGQDLLVGGNAEITGNLTVQGTTTTTNSTTVTIDDPIFTLGGDTAPSSDDNMDRGIEFRYYDSQARLGFFGWDDSASRFAVYHAATNNAEVFSGTRSGIDAGSIKLFDTSSEITITDLKNHVGFLASDELEGRASGTLGDEMAKDYINYSGKSILVFNPPIVDFDNLISPP